VKPRPTLGGAVAVLLPLQLIVKGAEAAFPLLLALWFGRNERTDVYYFAWAIFALAGSLVFSAFQDSAVVPVLAELRLSQPALVPAVRGSLLAYTVTFGGALAVAFGGAAAAWFSARYGGEARSLALASIAPFGVYLVALSIKTFLASMLNAEHRYVAQPVAGAIGALVTLAVVDLARGSLSIVAIPLGSAAGELVAVGVLAVSAAVADIAIAPTFARPEPVRRIARLVASEIGGSAATRVNPVVDQLMAALTGVAGGGTLLKLSGDIASVPTSLLQAAVLPVLLTHLSEHIAARDVERLRATLRRTLGVVIAVMVVSAAVLWAARAPLFEALLAHGAMDSRGVERMVHLFPYHLVGLAPFGALLVLARAHVAIQNSRIMVSMGVLNAILNVGLNASFVRPLGLEGLALATSVTYAGIALVFAVRLKTRLAAIEGDLLLSAPVAP
jgi:putative peptidoglycan lipid II flippase